jgi:hypothetical protein
MAGIEANGFSLDGCICAEAAVFAHRLQSVVLPPGALIQVHMAEGVEWELPAVERPRRHEAVLQDVLSSRLREVLDHEEEGLGQSRE